MVAQEDWILPWLMELHLSKSKFGISIKAIWFVKNFKHLFVKSILGNIICCLEKSVSANF